MAKKPTSAEKAAKVVEWLPSQNITLKKVKEATSPLSSHKFTHLYINGQYDDGTNLDKLIRQWLKDNGEPKAHGNTVGSIFYAIYNSLETEEK